MRTFRTILVDDERIGRSRLRRLLEKEPDLQILAECADGPDAVAAVREHAPDLLFLDINMPGMNGFDVLDALGPEEQPPVVIFVTAYDEHAVRAFEACALDYLLKPVSPERLGKALSRARERIVAPPVASARGEGALPEPPLEESAAERAEAARHPSRFMVRSGGRMSFIAPEEVDWAEAAGNYVILHVGPRNHMIRGTMGSLEEQLPEENFLRLSRSAIVNLRRVKELHASTQGEHAAVLGDGQRVHITRPLREVAERLSQL